MINVKSVAAFTIPYPDSASGLMKRPHMYICVKIDENFAYFVKCQTHKPYHNLPGALPLNRISERASPNRNPFDHTTLLDLDKIFIVGAADLVKMKYIGEVSNTLLTDIIAKLGTPEHILTGVS